MRPQNGSRGAPARLPPPLLAAALLLWLALTVARAQTGDGFDLSWNNIDGAAGSSSDAQYSVDGTAGQPDAATLSDGTYTLSGGFWAGVSSGPVAGCVGDCNGDGTVTVDELITGVNIALGNQLFDRCPSFDANGNGLVTVDELIRAVNNALNGCTG